MWSILSMSIHTSTSFIANRAKCPKARDCKKPRLREKLQKIENRLLLGGEEASACSSRISEPTLRGDKLFKGFPWVSQFKWNIVKLASSNPYVKHKHDNAVHSWMQFCTLYSVSAGWWRQGVWKLMGRGFTLCEGGLLKEKEEKLLAR